MLIRGRSCITAFMAGAILLLFSNPVYPSANIEAGHKYGVASQRFAELKKSSTKRKYRSYWIDCARAFEQIEKKYPKSPSASDACFDRAEVFEGLYHWTRMTKDLNEAIKIVGTCQSAYYANPRAPQALYHVIELALSVKKDNALAADAFAKLSGTYPDSAWTKKAKLRITPTVTAKVKRKKRKQESELREMPVPVIAASGKARPDGVVTNIRYWSGGAYTRIVIEQNSAVKFLPKELKNPDRLVFDLLSTRLSPSVDNNPLPVNDGILKQVRANQYAPDVVRIVLDLASLKSYVAFPLHEPDRLVIDVTGEGGKAPEVQPQIAMDMSQSDGKTPSGEKIEPISEPVSGSAPEPNSNSYSTTTIPKVPSVVNNDGEKLSLSRQLGLKIKTIAIDAGHGGHDPGAIGKSGLKEKTVTLDVAKRLAVLVKERLGCNVVMTRDKDVFIPLDKRPFIAKSKDADLFVSIHVNATRKRKTRGIETYIQSLRASDREAMATAARENATSEKKLSELKTEVEKILEALDKDNKLEDSLTLAHAVQGSLVDNLKPAQPHVVNLGVKRAFFYVLINTRMPSILAEIGFISNPEEEKLLRQEAYRQKIAESLYQGVKRFVEARDPQVGI